jgi:hypothetical protein
MFVNPSFINPSRKRRGKKRNKRKSRKYGARRRFRASGSMMIRRNAGVAPFLQANPLILSNPRHKRRKRHSNPLAVPNYKTAVDNVMSYAGGTAVALAITTVGTSKITNAWARRGTQLAASVVGGSMLGKKSAAMGGAFAGAMLYPLLQDLAADLLGIGVGAGVSAKEADLDALAADLEDVLDDMHDSDVLGDDGDDSDEEYAW